MMLLPGAGLAASSDPMAEDGRVVLGAKNVISGSETAKIRVRVPRTSRLSKPLAGGSGLEVTGGKNGFVGFALVEHTTKNKRITFIGGRLPDRVGLPPLVMGLAGPDNSRADLKVPAGDYDLYLITKSPDVKVTLRLDGLTGRKGLRPRDRVTARIATPDADYSSSVVDGAPKNLYSAGADGRTRGSGVVFDALWQQRQAHLNTLNTFCYYQSKPDPLHPAPYAPGCPTTSDRAMFVANDGLVNPQRSQAVHYGGGLTVGPTYLGQGFSVTSAGLLDDLEYVALWLSFD
ncbi:MAG TPA: hypothetical protein VM328_09465 [Fimbriimonadaceae bacterium]|nr:hypothetical protein [Fimbriimonadaceae bacterium]